ncbi:MAG: hypothetical protein IPO32_12220 [Crocinitomicaceae bacterium]|nr:hypothetical protein [Crocinitomicaceae bacterium]
MRKQKRVYEHKGSTREYLITLASFPNYLKLLSTKNKPYDQLLSWLIQISAQIDDQSFSVPTIKELSKKLKIDANKIAIQLRSIYNDIMLLNQNEPGLFANKGQIQCSLSFNYLGAIAYFNTGLNVLPTIGNHFNFYFLRPKLGGTSYYVRHIYHDLNSTGHEITVSLNCERDNLYLKLLQEKALLHKRISFMESIGSDMDDELIERLVNWSDAI